MKLPNGCAVAWWAKNFETPQDYKYSYCFWMVEIASGIVVMVCEAHSNIKSMRIRKVLLRIAEMHACMGNYLNGSTICWPTVIVLTLAAFYCKKWSNESLLTVFIDFLGEKDKSLYCYWYFTSSDEIFPTLSSTLRYKFGENLVSSFKDQSIFQIYRVSIHLVIDLGQNKWS